VLLSVVAAIALIFCLGLGILAMILVARGEDAIGNVESEAGASGESGEVTDCRFTGQFDPMLLYHAPVSAPSQHKTSVLGGEPYPIIRQNRGFYYATLTI
jgi:hypothetical protein